MILDHKGRKYKSKQIGFIKGQLERVKDDVRITNKGEVNVNVVSGKRVVRKS